MEETTVETSATETTADDLQTLMQGMNAIIASGTLHFEEVPKVIYRTRPAPTPDGKIAVMLRTFRNGYFLVDKNPECKGCGGEGLDKRKDASTKISEIPYCPACVLIEIQHFGRVWEGKLAEKELKIEQEEREERSDKKLESRLLAAREKVAELEKTKADALGQNVLDVEATKKTIEAFKNHAEEISNLRKEQAEALKAAMKSFEAWTEKAREVFDEATKAARATLDEKLANIKRERDRFVFEHGARLASYDADASSNTSKRVRAEEDLARYEAGPAKIARRWDEKIEPAQKTLERLERQWKSS
jgi:molecular chaperone DnaK (HSP70)